MLSKSTAAKAAIKHIRSDLVVGIGTGSTVEILIDLFQTYEDLPEYFVSSSQRTSEYLAKNGFNVSALNDVGPLDLYIDGADQVLSTRESLKGGGGAHTLEKLLAVSATSFIGIVDQDKVVKQFSYPVVVEVLPESRSFVAREIVALGGVPELRVGYKTDSGNDLLDVHSLPLLDAYNTELALKSLTGVVETGIFSRRTFDKVYVGSGDSVSLLGE